MAIHRIVTTTLGILEEDTPSSSRPIPPPPLSVATDAATTSDPLVTELPRTESEPLGSFSWRIGTNKLLLNKETTPFISMFSSDIVDLFKPTGFIARVGGGMRPVACTYLECLFFPHRSNWLSNLTAREHGDLFRFLFSSVRAWIIDDTGFPKQGEHSVGVARQYCGPSQFQPLPQHRVDVKVAEAITDTDQRRYEIQVLTKMLQHALGENLTSLRIELKRAREKAPSEELHLPLVVRIGNLVRRLSPSAKRAREQIEQVFVNSAKNVDDPVLS